RRDLAEVQAFAHVRDTARLWLVAVFLVSAQQPAAETAENFFRFVRSAAGNVPWRSEPSDQLRTVSRVDPQPAQDRFRISPVKSRRHAGESRAHGGNGA